MVDWVKGFLIPIVEITFIGGLVLTILFIVLRAFNKVYSTKLKWFMKYKIFKIKYDPKTVKWVLDAMNNGMDYWSAKKFLMMSKEFPTIITQEHINEVMWVFLKIQKQFKNNKPLEVKHHVEELPRM